MYCSACASPVTPGLKFCNRCGTNLSNEHSEKSQNGIVSGLITGVVLVALLGLGIMFGGAIALKRGGEVDMDTVALFMILSFLIVGTVEIFLLRQLSRLLGTGRRSQQVDQPHPLFQPASASPNELRATPLRALPEPIPSVTEHTTRTLEHASRESSR